MKDIKGSLKEKIALLRIRDGDAEAYGYLYDRYSKKIYRYIQFRINEQDAAYDLMQEVFLAVWESAHIESIKNLEALFYKIARNKVVDYYRLRSKQASLIDDLDSAEHVGIEDSESATAIDLELLIKKTRSLKQEYQDIIALRYLEDLSIKQISIILEKEPTTVRVTIHRALEALRKLTGEKNLQ